MLSSVNELCFGLKALEDNYYLISAYLTPSELRSFSQTSSSLYNLYASQYAWKSLMRAIFSSAESSTGHNTDFEEEKTIYTRESLGTSSTNRSKNENRSSKILQLRQDVLNSSTSTITNDSNAPLQPARNSVESLYEKKNFTERDINEIKALLQSGIEKFSQISKKIENLFALSSQHNQSLVSEVNLLAELKIELDENTQQCENDSMKKLLDAVRGPLSRQNTAVKDLYKDYSQKKRVITHQKTELDDAMSFINNAKLSFQACLLAGITKYSKNIDNILDLVEDIQQRAPSVAENFNYFLFQKINELLISRLPENKINLDYIFVSYNDPEYRAKVNSMGVLTKNISSKWEVLVKQREGQRGKFSTRDNIVTKKINHIAEVLRDLIKFAEKAMKLKEGEPNSGSLKSLDGGEREKKLYRLSSLGKSLSVESSNVLDWNNLLHWTEIKAKLNKELADVDARKGTRAETDIIKTKAPLEKPDTIKRLTPVKLKVRRESSGGNTVFGKEVLSKTTTGFFKPVVQQTNKVEHVRPKSSLKENRKEITKDEEEYLRTTFHPEVKWKIL